MSKISEFYTKAMEDETSRQLLEEILGDRRFEGANDEQLLRIGEVAKRLGYEISLEEAKAYLNGEETALDEDDLDAVAGGKGVYISYKNCETGYDSGDIKVATYY